ncbi:glycosyltransferase [Luteimonas sp. BDR2-5]|uniref:glycosyltransferase n=1 Tax=Proluteimonas luteida TaxID=2878685 RepID=UPI001E606337|nr:glycosyltransferase [Luteimonas sp. BDR2-5]MCD9027306.1 glycosyltransferase [Luteimonas sp. BDR2-5]
MRILLIAYEFPPSPSPQSLRWLYLTRELARLGYQVHVLTVDLPMQTSGLSALPTKATVHRTPGGPISALVGMLARRQAAKQAGPESMMLAENVLLAGPVAAEPMMAALALPAVRLNWKGRIAGTVIVALSRMFALWPLFPDARGAWFRSACRALSSLVEEIRPDLVVTSHEPATTLELGLLLKRRFGLPWIADLGDPVLADYTPRRWRSRSRKLERQVLANADGVTVTSIGTRELLLQRHAPFVRGVIEVLPQGFDDSDAVASEPPPADFFDVERLELLYTGSFYRFRRPESLIEAVAKVPQVRLNVATIVIPAWLESMLESIPGQVRLLGFLPHTAALALQRRADVLVNIANDNSYQVPGKVYEYLGSGRPILHIGNGNAGDVAAELVLERRRGWVCGNDAEAIAGLLRRLCESKRGDGGFPEVEFGRGTVAEFGWSRLAQRFADIATGIAPLNTAGRA